MVITYHRLAFVRVSQGELVLAFNPISKDSKVKASKFGADIVFISLDHPDANGIETVTYGDRTPFVIDGPGEYELRGIYIKGIPTVSATEEGQVTNTIYVVRLDDITLCHLGLMGSKDEITSEVREQIGQVDVVFVPVAAESVLSAVDAHKVATALEPSFIVPLYDGDEDALKKFLKEEGGAHPEPVEKLTLKKKDLVDGGGTLAVVRPQ